MSIEEKEKELFDGWNQKREYKSFVCDGVFDEETYCKQKLKILYILKEANWEGLQGKFDLVDYLLNNPKSRKNSWRTWNNVARWTIALTQNEDFPRYIDENERHKQQRKIAFINLKKEAGGASADKYIIKNFAEKDREYINNQIKIYNPDLIICCGRGNGKNADLLHDCILGDTEKSEWCKSKLADKYNYFYFSFKNKRIPIVSFVHPQMHGGYEIYEQYYNDMCKIRKELNL